MKISLLRSFLNNPKLLGAFAALMLISFLGLSGTALAEDWPMFLKDPLHSAKARKAPSVPLTLKWKFDTEGPIYSSPVVSGGHCIYRLV